MFIARQGISVMWALNGIQVIETYT